MICDGWWVIDAVTLGCPCWDGGKAGGKESENYLLAKQRKQNLRSGNCEQTAERAHGGVHVLYECGGCECQRGEVFIPHATDKSHLSGRIAV